MKYALKNIIFWCIFLGAIFNWYYRNDRQQKLKEEQYHQQQEQLKQYLNSPKGQDETANMESLNTSEVVTSKTGNKYYRGMQCSSDCSGHIAGYEWALDLGITNDEACDNESFSFEEGYLKGIEDVLLGLREYFKETYPEDYCNDDVN